jgi:hypothetical protein
MTFATGDTVKHVPSGEEWLLIRLEGEYVYPGGWPKSRALAADCRLVARGTAEDIAWIVAQLAKAASHE